MKKYYLLILLGICFISCKNQNPLPDMQLGALTDYDIEAFDTSPRYFKDYYCCPIKSIEYKRISLGHCIFNGRVLFCYSKPLQKIDS